MMKNYVSACAGLLPREELDRQLKEYEHDDAVHAACQAENLKVVWGEEAYEQYFSHEHEGAMLHFDSFEPDVAGNFFIMQQPGGHFTGAQAAVISDKSTDSAQVLRPGDTITVTVTFFGWNHFDHEHCDVCNREVELKNVDGEIRAERKPVLVSIA